MEYRHAKKLGDRGESVVRSILRYHQTSDARTVNNVLLDGVDTTTQIDHLYIDRFGVLIIETKRYNALIRGTSTDLSWTACYRGGKRQSFLNPIHQNEGHRVKLLRVLQQNNLRLDPAYIQSVIVFATGNLKELELADEDRARVMGVNQFVDHLKTRSDFAPNPGALSPGQISSIAQLFEELNRVADSSVRLRHDELVRNATKPKKRKAPLPRPKPQLATQPPPQVAGKSLPAPLKAAILFFASLAIITSCLIPMVIVLLAGSGAPNPDTTTSTSTATSSDSGGASPASGYDVPLALARLEEADTDVYKSLVDPQHPMLSMADGYPTYTWQFITYADGDRANISAISIALDDQGRIIGVHSQ